MPGPVRYSCATFSAVKLRALCELLQGQKRRGQHVILSVDMSSASLLPDVKCGVSISKSGQFYAGSCQPPRLEMSQRQAVRFGTFGMYMEESATYDLLGSQEYSASLIRPQIHTLFFPSELSHYSIENFAIMSFQVVECKTIDGVVIRGRFYGVDGKEPAIIMTPGVCEGDKLVRFWPVNSVASSIASRRCCYLTLPRHFSRKASILIFTIHAALATAMAPQRIL